MAQEVRHIAATDTTRPELAAADTFATTRRHAVVRTATFCIFVTDPPNFVAAAT